MKPYPLKEHTALKLPQLLRISEDISHPNTDRKNKKAIRNTRKSPPLPQPLPNTVNRRYDMEAELRKKAVESRYDSAVIASGALGGSSVALRSSKQNVVSMSSALALEVRKKIRSMREPHNNQRKEDLRESKLLLYKNMETVKKKKNLGFLLQYEEESQKKHAYIKKSGKFRGEDLRSLTPLPNNNQPLKTQKSTTKKAEKQINCEYTVEKLVEVDFLKLFILEQLTYFLSQTVNRSKEEMLGFCRIYMQNNDRQNHLNVCSSFGKREVVEEAVILEKLCLYVILLLSTDAAVNNQTELNIKNISNCVHKNNLLILDVTQISIHLLTFYGFDRIQLLMTIIEVEKVPVVLQFHIFNTMRFNEDRRKINSQGDPTELLKKNSLVIKDLLRTIVNECPFESLKAFAADILDSDASFEDKFEQIVFVVASLVLASTPFLFKSFV